MENVDEFVQQIAEALASYEVDEPHDEGETVDDNITWLEIVEGLKQPHIHKSAVTCVRCLAEDWLRKAKFIAARIGEKHDLS